MGKKSDAPIRSCIGCRSKLPKESLVRFAIDKKGRLRADPSHKMAGRGAYLCPNLSCFKLAFKKKGAFNRAFRQKVGLPTRPEELINETIRVFEEERINTQRKLERLKEGEGKRLSLSLQRINKVIERLRLFEE
jgi:predicted RNA-binding protein YlxR (DUF448 family)